MQREDLKTIASRELKSSIFNGIIHIIPGY